jgi:lysophospholipase L1-like esterase
MANVRVPPFDEAPSTVVGSTPTTEFDFDFPFWSADDILVYVDDELLDAADYTVEGLAVQDGEAVEGGYGSGTVTLDTAVSNVTVTIDRQVVGDRESQFSTSSPLGMRALNADLNRVTARQQDLSRRQTAMQAELDDADGTIAAALATSAAQAAAAALARSMAEAARDAAGTYRAAALQALADMLEFAANAPEAASIVNKLNRTGDNVGSDGATLRSAIGVPPPGIRPEHREAIAGAVRAGTGLYWAVNGDSIAAWPTTYAELGGSRQWPDMLWNMLLRNSPWFHPFSVDKGLTAAISPTTILPAPHWKPAPQDNASKSFLLSRDDQRDPFPSAYLAHYERTTSSQPQANLTIDGGSPVVAATLAATVNPTTADGTGSTGAGQSSIVLRPKVTTVDITAGVEDMDLLIDGFVGSGGAGTGVSQPMIMAGFGFGQPILVRNFGVSSTELVDGPGNTSRQLTTDIMLAKAVAFLNSAPAGAVKVWMGGWGTNDSKSDTGTTTSVFKEAYVTRIAEMRADVPDLVPILFTAPRGREGSQYENNPDFNQALREVAAETGCSLFDIEALFDKATRGTDPWHATTNPQEPYEDDVHPSTYGRELIQRSLAVSLGLAPLATWDDGDRLRKAFQDARDAGFTGNWDAFFASLSPMPAPPLVNGLSDLTDASITAMATGIEYARERSCWDDNAFGLMLEYQANIPPLTRTGGKTGLRIEGAAVNRVKRPRLKDGSASALPTGTAVATNSGCSWSYKGSFQTEFGECFRLGLSGTPVSTIINFFWTHPASEFPAIEGDKARGRLGVRLVGGSVANLTSIKAVQRATNSGGSTLTTGESADVKGDLTLNGAPVWVEAAHTGPANTAGFRLGLAVLGQAGVSIGAELVLEIYAPNQRHTKSGAEEYGDLVGTPILPTPQDIIDGAYPERGAATCTYDATPLLSPYGATHVDVRFRFNGDDGGVIERTVLQWDDGTEDERIRVYRTTAGDLFVTAAVGGATTVSLDLGACSVDADHRLALSIRAGELAASFDGGAVVSAAGDLPTIDTGRIGHGVGGAKPLWGIVYRDDFGVTPGLEVADADLPSRLSA